MPSNKPQPTCGHKRPKKTTNQNFRPARLASFLRLKHKLKHCKTPKFHTSGAILRLGGQKFLDKGWIRIQISGTHVLRIFFAGWTGSIGATQPMPYRLSYNYDIAVRLGHLRHGLTTTSAFFWEQKARQTQWP